MSYLSRIRINPLRSGSRDLLGNPRRLHGAVMGGLADDPERQRPLWRLDSDNPHRPKLLVLSESKPDWTHLVEQAGWPHAEGEHYELREYEPLLTRLAVGEEFTFRVTANPVRNAVEAARPTQPNDSGKGSLGRSPRTAHRTAEAQLGWFLQRTEKWGFSVPGASSGTSAIEHSSVAASADSTDATGGAVTAEAARVGTADVSEFAGDVRITARERHSFAKKRGSKPVVLHTATFEGRLRVTSVELLRRALLHGVGPAKAYGCGLLTLAPLPPDSDAAD
ncbi:type I-E CRISPR-associated protein Cas6/Cse3/CasE [Actinopolyspora sp. H202]|uniref:CRISPR system Cascade subunit CasE n=1 Tax=Actinopolyspora mzabensis TaxID=995066 RepID=A0A1G9C9B0_ACTMZ|nr:type I-E CRISPR-associated protein Cas6/Cse3/CasE [Actinopolyspora mzabensis]SDK48257.1 CRISPR system Cascade subunit CasE [Actinopolyspora mzabensis]